MNINCVCVIYQRCTVRRAHLKLQRRVAAAGGQRQQGRVDPAVGQQRAAEVVERRVEGVVRERGGNGRQRAQHVARGGRGRL